MKSTGDINFTNTSVMSLPMVTWNVAPNTEQTGAEWYVGSDNKTVAYIYNLYRSYVVRVAGTLRLQIRAKETIEVVDQADLWQWGITTDAQLDELVGDKKKFKYLENPWFEIVDPIEPTQVLGTSHNIFIAVQSAVTTLGRSHKQCIDLICFARRNRCKTQTYFGWQAQPHTPLSFQGVGLLCLQNNVWKKVVMSIPMCLQCWS